VEGQYGSPQIIQPSLREFEELLAHKS
jgi:hypothetical protein